MISDSADDQRVSVTQAVYDARFHAAFLEALKQSDQSEPKSTRAIALKLFLGQVWSGGMKIYIDILLL